MTQVSTSFRYRQHKVDPAALVPTQTSILKEGSEGFGPLGNPSKAVWDHGRFVSPLSGRESGFRTRGFESPTLIQLKGDAGRLAGYRRDAEDKSERGQFVSGEVVLEGRSHLLEGALTERVIFGTSTSALGPTTETSLRHRLPSAPDPTQPMYLRRYKRVDGQVRVAWEATKRNLFTPLCGTEGYSNESMATATTTSSGFVLPVSSAILGSTTFLWAKIDTNAPEFMVDSYYGSGLDVVANQPTTSFDLRPQWTSTFAGSTDVWPILESLDIGLETFWYQPVGMTPQASSVYRGLTTYFPLVASSFQMHENPTGTNLVAWSSVARFTTEAATSKAYLLDPVHGKVFLNPVATSYPELRVGYIPSAALEYQALGRIDLPSVHQGLAPAFEPAGRIADGDVGSYFYVAEVRQRPNAVVSIVVDGIEESGGIFRGFVYGERPVGLTLSLQSFDGTPLSGIRTRLTYEGVGRIGFGNGTDISVVSDVEGKVRALFVVPGIPEAGVFFTSVLAGSSAVSRPSTSPHYFIDGEGPFVTYVRDQNELPNIPGIYPSVKHTVLYRHDTSAIHPVTGSLGAYVPIEPISVGSTSLTYGTALPTFDPAGSTSDILGFLVLGPRKGILRVTVEGQEEDPLETTFVTTLAPEGHGNIFGWRLPGVSSVASQLNGGLWLTLNPYFGSYNVLAEGTVVDAAPPFLPILLTVE